MRSAMFLKAAAILVVYFVVGFLIWAYSEELTGFDEPWDSGLYGKIVISSFFVGLLVTGSFYYIKNVICIPAAFAGMWSGQVLALLTCTELLQSGWLLLGIVTTGIGALCVSIVMSFGVLVRSLLENIIYH